MNREVYRKRRNRFSERRADFKLEKIRIVCVYNILSVFLHCISQLDRKYYDWRRNANKSPIGVKNGNENNTNVCCYFDNISKL